jgi:dolichol-phosphate mannosyltransferase
LDKVRAGIKKYQLDYLLINDGSADGTQKLIEKLAAAKDYVYYREFASNAGHQSALRAGLNAAVGYDAAITMDADLQHPPELIPSMIEQWEAGNKIVQMVRQDSARQAGTFKYLTSRLYYAFINFISDLKLEYGASDFRLVDQSVVKVVAVSEENDLFLRGYFSWLPVSRCAISYQPNARIAGSSKYSLKKMLDLAYQSVLQFSEKPLRIAVSIGIIMAAVSLIYGVILALMRIFGEYTVSGWTSLMVVLLFCFGINFIIIGIIGSYMAHSISIQKKRPHFIVANEKVPGKDGK